MIVVDASVWVSMFVVEDSHHDVSRAWLEQQVVAAETLLAPTLVTAEVAGSIARMSGNSDAGHLAAARLRTTFGVDLFELDHVREATVARLAADLRLRGADATYAAIAHEVGAPLATWDHEQRERGSLLIRTFEPDVPRSSIEG